MIDKRMGKEREIIGKAKWTQPARSGHHGGLQDSHIKYVEKGRYQPNEIIPSTDLAKQWDGFKVGGIKPSYEPIIWAVKPPEGSYVDNVLKWGVGAVNVDECRIGTEHKNERITNSNQSIYGGNALLKSKTIQTTSRDGNSKGRFPANVILSHHPECVQVGVKNIKPKTGGRHLKTDCGKAWYKIDVNKDTKPWAGPDGLETVESWDCHLDCAVRLLDEQSGERQSKWGKDAPDKISGNINFVGENRASQQQFKGDSGGASRFFYCAKASRGERNAGLEGTEEKNQRHQDGRSNSHKCFEMEGCGRKTGTVNKNNHPTVKPIKLFEWLIKLVTREGQIMLDPFIGSGTTSIAAHNTGRKCVGIEKEEEYIEIAKRRATHWRSRPRQLEII